MADLYRYELELLGQGYRLIAGADEVGRGALAGPVVAAAVILPAGLRIDGIRDSKLLSPAQREHMARVISRYAIASGCGYAWQQEVDEVNVFQATKRALLRAIRALPVKPDFLLIDAVPLPELETPHRSIIKGDMLSASIAAASILAKVQRDRFMTEQDSFFPVYRFARNKGYGTAAHLEALAQYGPCPLHRKTFSGVKGRAERLAQVNHEPR